jgi:hypothetical protein
LGSDRATEISIQHSDGRWHIVQVELIFFVQYDIDIIIEKKDIELDALKSLIIECDNHFAQVGLSQYKLASPDIWKEHFTQLWPSKGHDLSSSAQNYHSCWYYLDWKRLQVSAPPDITSVAHMEIKKRFDELYWMPAANSNKMWNIASTSWPLPISGRNTSLNYGISYSSVTSFLMLSCMTSVFFGPGANPALENEQLIYHSKKNVLIETLPAGSLGLLLTAGPTYTIPNTCKTLVLCKTT